MDELMYRWLNIFFDADDGGGGGDTDTDDGGNDDGDDNAGDDKAKTFTQAELNAMIQRRLTRAQKQWEADAEEARKRANMDETERLKAEKEEAERKAQDAQTAANQRI